MYPFFIDIYNMQIEFTKPSLIKKSSNFEKFPEHDLPEIAVFGRSNVGKSSFVNHFLKSPNLSLTSGTPGRTRDFFFFNIHDKVVFVDLPGYGYAEVSRERKKNWSETMKTYISKRTKLELVLLLVDIRRKPNEDDLKIFDMVLEAGLAMILVLTKVDKMKKNEIQKNTNIILETFDINECAYVHYSSHENLGRPELSKLLNQAFKD